MGARTPKLTAAALAVLLAASTGAAPAAHAIILDAEASPASISVTSKGASSVSVQWIVERNVPDTPTPSTVSSSELQVFIGASETTTLPRSLSAHATGTSTIETIRIRETVQIPQSLIYRAVKENSPIVFQRSFSDTGQSSQTAQFEVRPSGEGSAALTVQRLELSFGDDTRTKVQPKGGELRAVVEVNTTGVGLLTGQWEVATSASTAGTPVFRALTQVRQGVAAGGRTVITSPPLPTGEEGTGLVRFRVIDPELTFETPGLQYYVTPAAVAAAPSLPRSVLLTAPRAGAQLAEDTHFAWNALAGAKTYQIAFYEGPQGPAEPLDPAQDLQAQQTPQIADNAVPLAGVFVPGDTTDVMLQAFTLAQLPAGRRYLWQVLAIDASGAEIGSSAVREIYKP